jgi:hypothetical protein
LLEVSLTKYSVKANKEVKSNHYLTPSHPLFLEDHVNLPKNKVRSDLLMILKMIEKYDGVHWYINIINIKLFSLITLHYFFHSFFYFL